MTLSTTVSTSVSQGAITKITRLFNGTLLDVLNELFQNGRRGAAGHISISTKTDGGRSLLCVADDGTGIDDPADLITLGQSGWDDDVARREDPAGMGMFSLAGRYVEIRSWSPRHATGWKMVIGPDDWESSTPIAIETCDIASGTEICFELCPAWEKALSYSIAAAASYYPLPVTLDGEAIDRADWLAEAEHIEVALGCRIGVFRGRTLSDQVPRINFHGVTVPCRLPSLIECGREAQWSVGIDIIDAPQLQLVLPARKEMIENAGLEGMRAAAMTAIFRAIAKREGHRLSHKDWLCARERGVDLPEPRPRLMKWSPLTAECTHSAAAWLIDAEGALLTPCHNPNFAQCLARALEANPDFPTPLVEPEPGFAGYGWYDALPRIEDCEFLIVQDGKEHLFDETDDRPDLKSGRADSIRALLHIATAEDAKKTVRLAADLFISYDRCLDYEIEDAAIFMTRACAIDVDDLIDLLEAICFEAHLDSDADSWETQHDQFLLDARQLAIEQILDADEALITRCGAVVSKHLRWLVPQGRMIIIHLGADPTRIEISDIPAVETEQH
ncbi:ATP-binding protein [Sphingobium sp. SA916]|uniref:ATP-binding protein n=1 Tax=Sphingobium sp. SA916 TaxID=1851207 RepID=UPI000C9F3415|nr:ATP-binding protein [Sphingobium sp. SA916]PNQ04033.1 hypothetical protein A8G00_09150 [Sphingobium sp. SA916]